MNESEQRQTILIVDDVPSNIKTLGESLKSIYKVRIATDGIKALKIATSSSPPDLILLDIVMPEMDGYKVCEKLKADKKTFHIPVIFITAKDNEKDETKGLELGAVDYIVKPFSLPIVKARVKTHLELKQHRDFLENLSSLDGLTGIPNRRRFDEFLDMEWERAIQNNTPISMIMIDIDYFKAFNDNYGHIAGDDCLRQVADCLKNSRIDQKDLVSRYGGEEFAVILPETNAEEAVKVAETMRNSIASLNVAHSSNPGINKLTISLGTMTITPNGQINPDVLIKMADKCLYEAKHAGRNCVVSKGMDD